MNARLRVRFTLRCDPVPDRWRGRDVFGEGVFVRGDSQIRSGLETPVVKERTAGKNRLLRADRPRLGISQNLGLRFRDQHGVLEMS